MRLKRQGGWVNVDLWAEEADLHLDLREYFPFSDRSVSLVYSEHFLEHLEYPEQAVKFLRESWRVLLPGGILKYAYDFETLARVLKQAGFVSITRRSFIPNLDLEARKMGTL